jgi:hypothetical protein
MYTVSPVGQLAELVICSDFYFKYNLKLYLPSLEKGVGVKFRCGWVVRDVMVVLNLNPTPISLLLA